MRALKQLQKIIQMIRLPHNPHHYWQAIINLTPDSFSDGGLNFKLDDILKNIISLHNQGVRYFDLGAQSTAPNATVITLDEEIFRFKNLFIPLLKLKEFNSIFIDSVFSFDTYRYETIEFLISELSKVELWPKEFIWNDVSGVVDEFTLKFLEIKKPVSLVLCHNLMNKRNNTPNHFTTSLPLNNKEFLNNLIDFFREKLSLVPSSLHHKIIIDPCFGFSKNTEQNIYLLNHLSEFFLSFPKIEYGLIGISRKKFLRQLSGLEISQLDQLDALQKGVFQSVLPKLLSKNLLLRSHSSPF